VEKLQLARIGEWTASTWLLALLSRETPDWFHFALENGKFLRHASSVHFFVSTLSHPIAQSPDSLDHLITTHYCWDTSICYLVSDLCDNRYRNRYRHFQPTTPEVLYRITVAGDSEIWMVRIFWPWSLATFLPQITYAIKPRLGDTAVSDRSLLWQFK